MKKTFVYLALSAIAMGFSSAGYGDEPQGSDSQLIGTSCHEENVTLQEDKDTQPEKIYIESHNVSIFNGQIFAYLNEQWESVAGLFADEGGLYVVSEFKMRDPDCPKNLVKPLCPNDHLAVYKVFKPDGKFHRFLCQYHGCDYEYHKFRRNYMPPGYYIGPVEK